LTFNIKYDRLIPTKIKFQYKLNHMAGERTYEQWHDLSGGCNHTVQIVQHSKTQ